ncbi:dihydrofolate reductase family protein [Cryobacterium cryoconiti]|uniref:dihydrofolate reductase family protein n=1 Tax=Cryobacterium cryoconiti TaxID=1259239 RepID=UPI001F545BA0|nr:dihydrofolate reductase family protein [Cryobacterium cryoconiti]
MQRSATVHGGWRRLTAREHRSTLGPKAASRAASVHGEGGNEAHGQHLPHPGWRHAGPGRPGRGHLRRLRARGLARPPADEGFGRIVDGWFAAADATLLGRTTYLSMQPYWEQVTDPDNPVATALNGLPKYVVSTTLTDPTWNNSTVVATDILESVAQLKARPGRELQVHGSCLLARSLHDAGLVDEYRLIYFPVVVGQGKRLFDSGSVPSTFTLEQCVTTNAGAVGLTFRPTTFVTADLEMPEGGAEAVREQH